MSDKYFLDGLIGWRKQYVNKPVYMMYGDPEGLRDCPDLLAEINRQAKVIEIAKEALLTLAKISPSSNTSGQVRSFAREAIDAMIKEENHE